MKNINRDLAFQDNEEFLAMMELAVCQFLRAALTEKKDSYLFKDAVTAEIEWIDRKCPDMPEENIQDIIWGKAEMSYLAEIPLSLPCMLFNLMFPEAKRAEESDDFYDKLQFDYVQKAAYYTAALFLQLAYVERKSVHYQRILRICCEKKENENVLFEDLIRLCSDGKNGRLGPYEGTKHMVAILSLFFPELSFEVNPLTEVVAMDDRLYTLISGESGFLPSWLSVSEPEDTPAPMLYRDGSLEEMERQKDRNIFVLTGERLSGKSLLAQHYCTKQGMKLICQDISELMHVTTTSDESGKGERHCDPDYGEISRRLVVARRECLTEGGAILVNGLGEGCEPAVAHLCTFAQDQLSEIVEGVFICFDGEKEVPAPAFAKQIILERFKVPERIGLWEHYLGETDLADKMDVTETAATFDLAPGQIRQAAEKVLNLEEKADRKKLHKICYTILNSQLSTQAARVDSGFVWDDLKLDIKNKNLLRDVCNAVENKPFIMQKWNFSSKLPYGSGITVLFAGPPGTGKTMAASVIANELGMELYKIDLSRMIDKYVGETEKNIRRIFNMAARSNCILFFDEADAIFNKRMDAKDANERFANIESSLLLQCIEEYEGVAILATNKMNAMDPAFMRRFRFYLQFSEPDEETARGIWENVFPKELPLGEDIDFAELAHIFKFTGAIIKNVAVQAAYLAAAEQKGVETVHILRAARREMEKNQRVITREELGELAYLYNEMMRD